MDKEQIHLERLERARLKLEMGDFVYKEKCPLCGEHLYGEISHRDAYVYCDSKEYGCYYVLGKDKAMSCKYTYYGSTKGFHMESVYEVDRDEYSNCVYELDTSTGFSLYWILEEKKLLFKFNGPRLFFKSGITEEEMMEKFRILNVFG